MFFSRKKTREHQEQPGPRLAIYRCQEEAHDGTDCWEVAIRNGEMLTAHIPYAEAYKQVYGVYPKRYQF